MHIVTFATLSFAIDHRTWKTELPVRSVVLKPYAGRLVVGWVTTSEYLLLIVLPFFSVCGDLDLSPRRDSVLEFKAREMCIYDKFSKLAICPGNLIAPEIHPRPLIIRKLRFF